jgi:hypothetical protein
MIAIQLICCEAYGGPTEMDGLYLKGYIPDTDAEGRGDITVTSDLREAKQFRDIAEAWEFWKQQSKVYPIRPDGKPNRPLTAWTITFEVVP